MLFNLTLVAFLWKARKPFSFSALSVRIVKKVYRHRMSPLNHLRSVVECFAVHSALVVVVLAGSRLAAARYS